LSIFVSVFTFSLRLTELKLSALRISIQLLFFELEKVMNIGLGTIRVIRESRYYLLGGKSGGAIKNNDQLDIVLRKGIKNCLPLSKDFMFANKEMSVMKHKSYKNTTARQGWS